MNKELNAFKEIVATLEQEGHIEEYSELQKWIDIVETALSEKETTKKLNGTQRKKINAVNIYHNKKVDIALLKLCDDNEEYNDHFCPSDERYITQAEYELLNEVF